MKEIDVWRTAGMLVSRHGGEQAALTAAMRADALLDQGYIAGSSAWQRILKAIGELDRVRRRDGAALN